eukprot:360043-Chlamydomonas_euryale.AAC.5
MLGAGVARNAVGRLRVGPFGAQPEQRRHRAGPDPRRELQPSARRANAPVVAVLWCWLHAIVLPGRTRVA